MTTKNPTYRIRAAAALSGVREELIRAWERRYGVLSPVRTPGGYRVYTPEDIHVLRRLKELTDNGISISEAARMVPQLKTEGLGGSPIQPALPGEMVDALERWRARVMAGAAAHDQAEVEQVLDEAFSMLPPLRLLDGLITPLMRELGDAWERGEVSVAQEHLVSQVVRGRVGNILHSAPRGSRRHVVAAGFPDEQHELGLMTTGVRFRFAGWRVTSLGPRIPADELESVVRAVRPNAIALSCVFDPGKTVFRAQLASMARSAGRGVLLLVGGRAAEHHAADVQALGGRLLLTPEQWQQVLD